MSFSASNFLQRSNGCFIDYTASGHIADNLQYHVSILLDKCKEGYFLLDASAGLVCARSFDLDVILTKKSEALTKLIADYSSWKARALLFKTI